MIWHWLTEWKNIKNRKLTVQLQIVPTDWYDAVESHYFLLMKKTREAIRVNQNG